jgi:predicted acyl esterase
MKRGWMALVLLVPLFAGCLGGTNDYAPQTGAPDVGYNAESLKVSGVAVHDLIIASDDLELSAILYEPLTQNSINGQDPRWPLVVFVHPWGFPKETYENAPLATGGAINEPSQPDGAPSQENAPQTNLLQKFAEAGIMVIAYDTRGWGQSGGQSTIAGEGEMRDLRAVIDYANANFLTNNRTGVTGISYGGGHAYRAWAEFDDVITAVPHNGWTDLFHAMFPGNVVKTNWGAELYAFGAAGGGGGPRTSPVINDWLATMTSRQNPDEVDGVHRQLDARSILHRGVVETDKPLLVCSGLQDTLFNQNHFAWYDAPGMVKSVYYQGGHNTFDEECWDKTLEWFQFHLAGIDNGADSWPFLQTVDVNGDGTVRTYSEPLARGVDHTQLYLREGQLVNYVDQKRTFSINQQLAGNPITEPGAVYENTGQSNQDVPEQFRQDPFGIQFESATIDSTVTVLGAPTIFLVVENETVPPYQVIATLFHKHDGSLTLVGQGATNPLAANHLDFTGTQNATTIQLPWIKMDISPGDQIVLELASSEPNTFQAYPGNFYATFTGQSFIDIPFFGPKVLN